MAKKKVRSAWKVAREIEIRRAFSRAREQLGRYDLTPAEVAEVTRSHDRQARFGPPLAREAAE